MFYIGKKIDLFFLKDPTKDMHKTLHAILQINEAHREAKVHNFGDVYVSRIWNLDVKTVSCFKKKFEYALLCLKTTSFICLKIALHKESVLTTFYYASQHFRP